MGPGEWPKSELAIRHRRLPHWEFPGSTYFVTFRLADSLPKEKLQQLAAYRKQLLAELASVGGNKLADARHLLSKRVLFRLDRALDRGTGECHLRHPAAGKLVSGALTYFDGSRYSLFAWCVMPNHVHAIVRPESAFPLAKILHSWKSFSAKKAMQLLHLKGRFWQREYYDHILRDQREFDGAIGYVLTNPERAGLKDWPWAGYRKT